MTEDEQKLESDQSESPLNKQMSPVAGGGLLGAIVFGFVLFQSHDVLRALLVGGVVFGMIFWVMWAGQYLERRTKKKNQD